MIVHTHPEPIVLPYGGSFYVIPFSDTHVGAANCVKRRLEEKLMKPNAGKDNVFFIDIGDTLDAIGPKDYRQRPHEIDPEIIGREDFVDAQIEMYLKMWRKYGVKREQWIGMCTGNHHDSIKKFNGTDITNRLCAELGGVNLGWEAFVRLQIKVGTRSHSTVLYVEHGHSGGRKPGAAINSMTDHALLHPGASVYCAGHNHRLSHYSLATCRPDWNRHKEEDDTIEVINTGTYMKTKCRGTSPGYAEKKGLPPTRLGHSVITYTHSDKRRGEGKRTSGLDISVSIV